MAKKDFQATAKLFLDVSDAKSDAKQFVADLKQQLSSIETAADKMTVFKDLVGYIGQVDKALSALRAKNAGAFDNMFDGLDADLRKVMESIFDTSNKSMSALDGLRKKLNDASNNGASLKELRQMAEEINNLFTSLGKDAPIDIDKQFSGRGKTSDHINILTDALDNFAIVWDGVNNKIKNGFGFKGTGAGGLENFSGDVQNEIDKLEDQLKRLKKLQQDISKTIADVNKYNDTGSIFSEGTKFTQQDIVDAIEGFTSAKKKFKNFKGDTSSIDYNEVLSQYLQQASKIASMYSELTNIGTENNVLFSKLKNVVPKGSKKTLGDMVKQLSTEAEDAIFGDLANSLSNFQGTLDTQINSIADRMQQLSSNNKHAALSYDELSKKVKEYASLQQKINSGLELDDDGQDLEDKIRKLDELFISLDKTGDKAEEIKKILGDLSFGDISDSVALEKLSKVLQIQKDGLNRAAGNNAPGTGSGVGTGTGNGSGEATGNIDFTSLENAIKTEASALSAKLDNILKVELVQDDTKDIQGAIDSIKATVDNISACIDNYNLSKDALGKQAEVDTMKRNLTQFLNYVSDFNSRKIGDKYQGQEISAAILSDGSISTRYGEDGFVPWDRIASQLVANLDKSLLVDIHSHPWDQFWNNTRYANDFFSGSKGDIGAFEYSKQFGAQMSAMITGNIIRTLDLSKLTDLQMINFREALAQIEKKYANTPKYSEYMSYHADEDKIYYKSQDTLVDQHKVTQAFEDLMYKAFESIGYSRDQVDQEIFKKYNLTDDKQLTELAERLVQLSHSSQSALSPVERLAEIISKFDGDIYTEDAKAKLKAFEKGELSAADVFNQLNGEGHIIDQDTMNSLFTIDTANEMSAVESLLTQITSILDVISSSVSNIDSNTRQSTNDKFDAAINDIVDISSGNINKHITDGIKSIFDPLNISEYKNKEVLTQADASVLDFKDSLRDLFIKSMADGVDINELNSVLNKFAVAISNIQDATKQIDLYEERTKENVYDGGQRAKDLLSDEFSDLTQFDNLQSLLYLLNQAKIDINKTKDTYKGGLANVSVDTYDTDGLLESIKLTLDSIYGVLQGFTGIEADNKNSIKQKEPVVDNNINRNELSEKDSAILSSILDAVNEISNYLAAYKPNDMPDEVEQDNNIVSEIYKLLSSVLSNNLATENTLIEIYSAVSLLLDQLTSRPVEQQNDSEYALEITLQAVKSVLDQIASKIDLVQKDATDDDNTNVVPPDNNIALDQESNSGYALETTLQSVQAVLNNILSTIQNKFNDQGTSDKQSEVDIMKSNLTQLFKYVSDFNERQFNNGGREQELSADILSDGSISIGYGANGHVGFDAVAEGLVANLNKSLLADFHSHPWEQFENGKRFADDSFSGSDGDLGAFGFSKQLGAKISTMIAGNIMSTFDSSKLTDSQMEQFIEALHQIEMVYAKDPAYSKYMEYDESSDYVDFHMPDSLPDAHKLIQIAESMMYEALKSIGYSKDQVDQEIFKKYDLTDDKQLTELAERLVQLSHSSQSALSPVERLAEIISQFGGDINSEDAKWMLEAVKKGEITAADAFNELNDYGVRVNQDTIDSLFTIDAANEKPAVESLLTQIISVLDVISSSVSNIDNNTRLNTSDQLDAAINDIIDINNGIINKHITNGVESIFDPLNVSRDNVINLYNQAKKSATGFRQSSEVFFGKSMDSTDGININELHSVLNQFAVAISNIQDAMRQADLYTARTGDEISYKDSYGNKTTQRDLLSDELRMVTSSDTLKSLLHLLNQAKIDLSKTKDTYKDGLGGLKGATSDSIDEYNTDTLLQSIQATLESIYTVLQGFTGIEADTKNSINQKKPVVDNNINQKELSEKDSAILSSILDTVNEISNYLATDKSNDTLDSPDYALETTLQSVNGALDNISGKIELILGKIPDNTDSNSISPDNDTNIAPDQQNDTENTWIGTLTDIRGILDQILSAITNNKSLSTLIQPLSNAVSALKDVSNGIIQHQKAQKSDTRTAQARITDPIQQDLIIQKAQDAVQDIGTDVQIASLDALADGIVRVSGAVKNANGVWEGFTVKVNEADEAVDLSIKKQSAFAKSLNKIGGQSGGDDNDDNPYVYDRAEVEARAKKHLDEYTKQGKQATVQFKDNGRYTIKILEEINGLSKEIFQTFDENDDKIERTTVTISNSQKAKLQNLKGLIDQYLKVGTISFEDEIYKQYERASDDLYRMNSVFRYKDNLSGENILAWNTQIKLVQQLGKEVQKLALKRENPVNDPKFNSKRQAQSNTFDVDYAKLKKQIAIPDSFTQRIEDAGNAIKNAANKDDLQIAQNNWIALRKEIEKTAIEQDLYIRKTSTINANKKPAVAYGTAQLQNFSAKYNYLQDRAQDVGLDENYEAVKNLTDAYQRLKEAQSKFQAGEDLTTEAGKQKVEEFKRAQLECNRYAKELNNVVTQEEKLKSNSTGSTPVAEDFQDTRQGRKNALEDFVNAIPDAAINKFNADFTELTYTVKNGDGTFTNMTATLNAARDTIYTTAGETERATTRFGKFWNELKGKMSGIATYLISMTTFQQIWGQIKQGVQYVREIDAALTELKKVTDETSTTYDAFLQNMSKTAGEVGSTVAELTTMAAEWARLGYSIEDAGKLAESTAILLNVSEFENATEASQALISTMQAFGYVADDSQHVVDILNEVGFKMPKLYSNI